ncbi:type VI secretion system baseplate subunit TssK [Candidatus Binatia bacterium]|nr:type VI secretion system baseplate subunit TssK [Candidatus Binatia bacterium]
MEPLRPVFWGQGMFLEPQHFQQQDWYHEACLHRYFRLFVPFCWGVRSLAVTELALQNFVFQIEHCEVVTWDGTLLRFRGDAAPSNARVEPRSFEGDLDAGGKPLSVYLAIRRLQPEGSNVEQATGAAPAGRPTREGPSHRRYFLESGSVADLGAAQDQTCEVHYLGYDVHLLYDVPVARSQDYELVKIAEVLRAADGRGGVLSKRYIPPAITVRSSPVLEGIVREIRDLLTAKGRELAEYRRRRGGEIVELGSRDVGFLLMMQTVNRYIPVLHHDLEVGDTPPHVVYARLRQLVGELSTYSGSVSVLGATGQEDALPPYRHDQLFPCFDLASRRIGMLLTEMTTGPVTDVQLRYDGEYFSAAAIDEQLFAGDNRYYLAIRSDLAPNALLDLLQDKGKITALEDMPKLEKSYLTGLRLEVLESPPEELLMRAHYRYFLIDRRNEHWGKIQERRTMAVYCPELPTDTEIRLVIVYGK